MRLHEPASRAEALDASRVTVNRFRRGTGPGPEVTAHPTPAAVLETGVCALGMCCRQHRRPRVYRGPGCTGYHLRSSRRLTVR